MCPISLGSPSRPASFSRVFLQPLSATSPSRRHASTARVLLFRVTRRRILSLDHWRARPEAGRAQRLVAGHRRTCERALRALLEDHPQALERGPQLPARPAAAAEHLLEALARRARLDREGHLHARLPARLARQLPRDLAARLAVAAAVQRLDDQARAL